MEKSKFRFRTHILPTNVLTKGFLSSKFQPNPFLKFYKQTDKEMKLPSTLLVKGKIYPN